MQNQTRRTAPSGIILVVVLIAIAMLSLVAFTFNDRMLNERKAVQATGRRLQARAAAESGLELVQQFLQQDAQTQTDGGGRYDNPGRFQAVMVQDDELPGRRSRFSVISPAMQDGQSSGIRFGLEDESTKININTLLVADQQVENGGRAILMQLPSMTVEIADAIMDWIDPDDDVRENGAESETYSGMSPPYAAKNGPLSSIDELLTVKGVTPELLYGLDVNRNGIIEPEERGSGSSGDASMDFGWSAYLTVYSAETNLLPDGTKRVSLNGNDMQVLSDSLTPILQNPAWVNYIIAYRQFGPYTGKGSTKKAQADSLTLDLTKAGKTKLTSVLDLIGSQVQMSQGSGSNQSVVDSPFVDQADAMRDYLPKLSDAVTVNSTNSIPGRININQASEAVLASIPGMTSEIAGQIVAQRTPEPSPDKPYRKYETWPLIEQIVTLDQMKALLPFMCGGGSVYRMQSVGFFDQSGPTSRIEAVIDASNGPPRIVFWRELSRLGRGFTPSTLGAEPP